ncbi:MAG: hypothetical protein HOE98_00835 [Rhodospirillaceae bacterium]|jgi:hypothetical protein|nr:hypothetical protein [Rhodospirillaceae bacterium]MBT3974958.1 hypothetical protein [Rhodospirillaceae bacterium]MBT5130348.1 hypothetical protein [Rhodospirillaceae bacterium]MBT6474584.1 hypothetical protein [Rhodospirillaceae bacterium]
MEEFTSEQNLQLQKTILVKLVKGEDKDDLLQQLLTRLDQKEADEFLSSAINEHDELLKSGKLRDFEYEHILNQPNSKAGQTQERIGLVMIGFGIILSAGSYFLAAPGETYVVYTGLILWGGYLAFISS